MPFVQTETNQIYWEEHGIGEPLLLIMGLGGTIKAWHRLLPALSIKYRVIVYDNRGIGASSDANGPFSIADMASDAKAVLEAAGSGSAHVLGVSMGGMIAQEFALNYPDAVRSLILAVTTCGGREAILADGKVLAALQSQSSMSAEDAFWAIAPAIYDDATPRSVLEEDLAAKQSERQTRQNYLAQLQAIMAWPGTFSRLDQIKAPTFVLHGANDKLVPPQNGRDLARAIPNARLVEIDNASHMFAADQPERSITEILSFLRT